MTVDSLRDESHERLPAQAIEAEQALLGAVLINNQAFDQVSGFLTGDHFYSPIHGRIFDAGLAMFRDGNLANLITLFNNFENDTALSEVGAAEYLSRLVASAVTIINAKHYGRTILNAFVTRELVGLSGEIAEATDGVYIEPRAIVEASEAKLFFMAQSLIADTDPTDVQSAAVAALAASRAAKERGAGLDGIATGYSDLDALLGGMAASDLLILAARPGMGKTALATCIAENAAVAGQKVVYFSLEMPADQLGRRLLSRATEISAKAIKTGKLDDDQLERLDLAAEDMADRPLTIIDDSGPSISQIRARCARTARTGLDLVVIDYLQLISASAEAKRRNRVDEVTEITTGLKALAKDIRAPVLALSQLSRAVEQREDKRPQLSDLRESGSIEQDADLVIFLHRKEYYIERARPAEGANMDEFIKFDELMAKHKNICDVLIEKNRNGETGAVRLRFDGPTTSFSNLARQGEIGEI